MTDCIRGKCVYNKAKEFAAKFDSFDKVFNKLIEFAGPGDTGYARYLVDKKENPKEAAKRLGRGEYGDVTKGGAHKEIKPARVPKKNPRKVKKTARKKMIARAQKVEPKPKEVRKPKSIPKQGLTAYAKELVENNPGVRKRFSDKLQAEDTEKVRKRAGEQRTTRSYGGDEVRIVEKKDPKPGPEKMHAARKEIRDETGKKLPGKTIKQTKKIAKRARQASQPVPISVEDALKINKRHSRVTGSVTVDVPRVQSKKQSSKPTDKPNSPQHARNTPSARIRIPEIDDLEKPIREASKETRNGFAKKWKASKHTQESGTKASRWAIRNMTIGAIRARLRL